jgi:hypothetical protein
MKIRMTLAALLCSVALVSAQSLFTATLDGAQDGGGARTGSGFISGSLDGNVFSFNGTFGGLSGTVNTGGFHIHGPAPAGANTGILYFLYPTMTLNPDNRSGTMNGSVTLTSQHIDYLEDSLLYFNIHTSTFSGGEIRGQIVPVPEPSTWALMGFGALGLLWSVRRKKA